MLRVENQSIVGKNISFVDLNYIARNTESYEVYEEILDKIVFNFDDLDNILIAKASILISLIKNDNLKIKETEKYSIILNILNNMSCSAVDNIQKYLLLKEIIKISVNFKSENRKQIFQSILRSKVFNSFSIVDVGFLNNFQDEIEKAWCKIRIFEIIILSYGKINDNDRTIILKEILNSKPYCELDVYDKVLISNFIFISLINLDDFYKFDILSNILLDFKNFAHNFDYNSKFNIIKLIIGATNSFSSNECKISIIKLLIDQSDLYLNNIDKNEKNEIFLYICGYLKGTKELFNLEFFDQIKFLFDSELDFDNLKTIILPNVKVLEKSISMKSVYNNTDYITKIKLFNSCVANNNSKALEFFPLQKNKTIPELIEEIKSEKKSNGKFSNLSNLTELIEREKIKYKFVNREESSLMCKR